jgi:hypothetical protein
MVRPEIVAFLVFLYAATALTFIGCYLYESMHSPFRIYTTFALLVVHAVVAYEALRHILAYVGGSVW